MNRTCQYKRYTFKHRFLGYNCLITAENWKQYIRILSKIENQYFWLITHQQLSPPIHVRESHWHFWAADGMHLLSNDTSQRWNSIEFSVFHSRTDGSRWLLVAAVWMDHMHLAWTKVPHHYGTMYNRWWVCYSVIEKWGVISSRSLNMV